MPKEITIDNESLLDDKSRFDKQIEAFFMIFHVFLNLESFCYHALNVVTMIFPLVLFDLDFECRSPVCTQQPQPDSLSHSTPFVDLSIVRLTFCTPLIEFKNEMG